MLLPHESTIGAGTGSAMVPSESSRGFGVGETISEGRENTLPLSPTEEEIGSNLPSEITNSENKMDDARKVSRNESKKTRVSLVLKIIISHVPVLFNTKKHSNFLHVIYVFVFRRFSLEKRRIVECLIFMLQSQMQVYKIMSLIMMSPMSLKKKAQQIMKSTKTRSFQMPFQIHLSRFQEVEALAEEAENL